MTIRLRFLPRFPARISGAVGITVVREGVDLVVKPDYGALTQVPAVIDPDANFFTVWNEDDDMYVRMSFGDVFDAVSGLGFMQTEVYDPQAIGADAFDYANMTGTINIAAIADGAITSAKIADGTIATGDIADSAITSAKIANGTIVTADLADSSVTSAKIVDGTIVAGDIADATITEAKIAAAAVAKFTATRGTAVSASGAAIDFTSIPAGVNRITLELDGLSTNGTSNIIVQMGGASVETSGYLGATSNLTGAGVSSGNWSSGAALTASGTVAARVYHGRIVMERLTGNQWTISVSLGGSDGTFTYSGAGAKTLSAQIERVRLTTAGGTDTFDAGTVNITWEY